MFFGTPMIMVLLLIVGKTIMDAAMHVMVHNKDGALQRRERIFKKN